MVFELRAESGSARGSLQASAKKLGINPETLRDWVEKAEVDAGSGPAPRATTGSASRNSKGKFVTFGGPMRS